VLAPLTSVNASSPPPPPPPLPRCAYHRRDRKSVLTSGSPLRSFTFTHRFDQYKCFYITTMPPLVPRDCCQQRLEEALGLGSHVARQLAPTPTSTNTHTHPPHTHMRYPSSSVLQRKPALRTPLHTHARTYPPALTCNHKAPLPLSLSQIWFSLLRVRLAMGAPSGRCPE
jgi:hypothetical protein